MIKDIYSVCAKSVVIMYFVLTYGEFDDIIISEM